MIVMFHHTTKVAINDSDDRTMIKSDSTRSTAKVRYQDSGASPAELSVKLVTEPSRIEPCPKTLHSATQHDCTIDTIVASPLKTSRR